MSDYNNDDIKDTEDEQKYEDVCAFALTVWSAASESWMAATMQI